MGTEHSTEASAPCDERPVVRCVERVATCGECVECVEKPTGPTPRVAREGQALALPLHSDGEGALEVGIELRLPDAIPPTRAHPGDIGLDLTAVRKVRDLPHGGALYDTGVAVCPPRGHYFEIVPRSSFSATGYVQPHSVGIVDPGYRGNLKIAVRKASDDVADLELPFRLFQLILREVPARVRFAPMTAGATLRGAGGFGSTNA